HARGRIEPAAGVPSRLAKVPLNRSLDRHLTLIVNDVVARGLLTFEFRTSRQVQARSRRDVGLEPCGCAPGSGGRRTEGAEEVAVVAHPGCLSAGFDSLPRRQCPSETQSPAMVL